MKMRCYNILIILLIVLSISAGVAQQDPAHQLYLQAKKFSFNQKWSDAAQLFQQLIADYPKSQFIEESYFWMAYCWEKDGENESAFQAFIKLEQLYPQSLWSDDAAAHKILLAEKMAQKPGDQFYLTLYAALQNDNNEIKLQAARALARLGDNKALPAFNSLRGLVEFDDETLALIRRLEDADKPAVNQPIIGRDEYLKNETNKEQLPPRSGRIDSQVNIFQEHRFEQYKAMTRKDNEWSEGDLRLFALWHILASREFDDLQKLDQKGREVWLDAFWKEHDPTPATPENECRDEFERRLKYARSKYDYYDRLENYYYAPWDARGEVYIKFGEPQKRTENDEGEFWYYPQHNQVTFFIRPHITNIFGRSIFISSLDNRSMRSVARPSEREKWRNFHNEYIYQPGFYYTYPAGK